MHIGAAAANTSRAGAIYTVPRLANEQRVRHPKADAVHQSKRVQPLYRSGDDKRVDQGATVDEGGLGALEEEQMGGTE